MCGRVWLVVEFIYLIPNQPSNSLIGPVPLLGNEGKWTITLVFVGNNVCLFVCVAVVEKLRAASTFTAGVSGHHCFYFRGWLRGSTLSLLGSSLPVCQCAGLALWRSPLLSQPPDALIGRVIPRWNQRQYFTQWNLALAGSHGSQRAEHHSSRLVFLCVSFRVVCYINCWSFLTPSEFCPTTLVILVEPLVSNCSITPSFLDLTSITSISVITKYL